MKITKELAREIINDFAKEIEQNKATGPKPATAVIDFRSEKIHQKERRVESVPIELLRYRKDNGRIISDVLSHERRIGRLDETDEEAQLILQSFLAKKDPARNEEVYKLIHSNGQDER